MSEWILPTPGWGRSRDQTPVAFLYLIMRQPYFPQSGTHMCLILGECLTEDSYHDSDSLATFQSRLKSHLFASTYHI